MMLFPKTLLYLLLLFSFSSVAQYSPQTTRNLAKTYASFFELNRERVFLHINKTDLLPKEDLWFAAYVYDSKLRQPNLSTTNLNADLFDISGKHIESKTIFINGGKGQGYFKFDTATHPPGVYILKASTNYMENFEEDLTYLQTFTILGEEKPVDKKNYDLHVLPEGGHLLAGQTNNLGVKLINDAGMGIAFHNARILDHENKLITAFESNELGMGKTSFSPEPGETYLLIIEDKEGREITQIIPPAQRKGINLSANFLKDQLIVSINTNKESIEDINKEKLLLTVHQEGKIRQYEFYFPENKLRSPISIPKDSLFPGINTLTIFNQEMKPLLERLIFNDSDIKRKRLNAVISENQPDSLEIALSSGEEVISSNSISVSVLPGNTMSRKPDHNIISAFYLKPHLKGEIQQGHYYFSDEYEKRKRHFDLDLLLLTQGWSKYSWDDIFNNPPHEKHPQQEGFNIEGQITDKKIPEDTRLFLQDDASDLFKIVELDQDQRFKIHNIFIVDSTSVSIGLLKGRNKKVSKPSIQARVLPLKKQSPLNKDVNYGFKPRFLENTAKENLTSFINGTEALDTVIIKGSNKTPEEIRNMVDATGHTEFITDRQKKSYPFLTSYLRMNGFKIVRNQGAGELYILSKRFGRSFSNIGEPIQPVIFLDNVRMQDYSILENMQMEDIESVYINKTGAAIMGTTSFGGVIKITTVKNGSLGNTGNRKNSTYKLITENGFAPKKEYYTPKYKSYTSKLFEDYGDIHWIGDTFLNRNGETSFKILNTQQPQVKLFIEGMTEDGDLISEEILLETR